jgi:hypothetical protein
MLSSTKFNCTGLICLEKNFYRCCKELIALQRVVRERLYCTYRRTYNVSIEPDQRGHPSSLTRDCTASYQVLAFHTLTIISRSALGYYMFWKKEAIIHLFLFKRLTKFKALEFTVVIPSHGKRLIKTHFHIEDN